jgi:hypothetical protein
MLDDEAGSASGRRSSARDRRSATRSELRTSRSASRTLSDRGSTPSDEGSTPRKRVEGLPVAPRTCPDDDVLASVADEPTSQGRPLPLRLLSGMCCRTPAGGPSGTRGHVAHAVGVRVQDLGLRRGHHEGEPVRRGGLGARDRRRPSLSGDMVLQTPASVIQRIADVDARRLEHDPAKPPCALLTLPTGFARGHSSSGRPRPALTASDTSGPR